MDLKVLALLPHAHYLCKRMEGFATLPDGTKRWLLLIKNWDFNWQGDYRYSTPVFLPRGTDIAMRYTYDNSAENPQNPNLPPKSVTYGRQSSDEMAELWLQVLLPDPAKLDVLEQAVSTRMQKAHVAYDEQLLRADPANVKAHTELTIALLSEGKVQEAERHARLAVQTEPQNPITHYCLGLVFRQQKRSAQAKAEFETVLRLNADDFKAHGNLAFLFLEEGDLVRGEEHLRMALRLNPQDQLARETLNELLKSKAARAKEN